MTIDNPSVNDGNPMIVLIQDVNDIHEKTDISIKDIDNRVNKSIALVQEGKMAMLPSLEELRIDLWIQYTEKNIEKIEKFIKDLSIRLVKVSEYRKEINCIKRKFRDVKTECKDYKILSKIQNLNKIVSIFNDSTILWNKLADNEEDLRREAWFNFLSKIYLPFSVIVSGGYWAIVKFVLKWLDFQSILLWWLGVLLGLYFLLFKWAKNPFKIEKEETED